MSHCRGVTRGWRIIDDTIVPSGSRTVISVGIPRRAASIKGAAACMWWAVRTWSFCASWNASTAKVFADRSRPSSTNAVSPSSADSARFHLASGR